MAGNRYTSRFMKLILRIFTIGLLLLSFVVTSYAASFTVRHISIEGLHHIQRNTVEHYLPIRDGQRYTDQTGNDIIAALYKTGFFSNVSLARKGDNLIVSVVEKASIGNITFNGNDEINSAHMKTIQSKSGLMIGRIFNRANLKEVVEGMQQIYVQKGYYHAKVTSKVLKLPNDMVSVVINVVAGGVARVQRIQFIGNHEFSQSELLDQFQLATPNLLSFFTDSDHFSENKLDQDIASLKNFYMNHGYLRFRVLSKQVTLTPQGDGVYIAIHISEGAHYEVSAVMLPKTLNPKYRPAIEKMVKQLNHETFSRKDIIATNNKIGKYLGDNGYAFPDINAVPAINDVTHTTVLHYQINSGPRIYVRKINFSGNTRTQDKVLRYNMRQMEGESYDAADIQESQRRLANLPYIKDIQMTPTHVKGKPDEVDLNYHVKDVSAGRANVMAGYSDLVGFLYGASVSQANVLGTGRYAGISFQRSALQQNYSLSYNNPFYTIYGLSRGFTFSYIKTTPGSVNLSTYTQDALNFNVNYGMPISEYDSINFGYGYTHNYIKVDPKNTPTSIQNYIGTHGSTFNEGVGTLGWSHSDLDRAVFPTEGLSTSLSASIYAPLNKKSLTYYKASFNGGYFLPIDHKHKFIVNFHTDLVYGRGMFKTKELPFFANYYAGGIGSVPGFAGNSLGPQATGPSNAKGTALGGDTLLVAGTDLIFPNPISDTIRTSLTFNAGNVFANKVSLKNLRYSVGIMLIWRSPIGPLDFSLAKAFNTKPGDDTQVFGFTMGANFS